MTLMIIDGVVCSARKGMELEPKEDVLQSAKDQKDQEITANKAKRLFPADKFKTSLQEVGKLTSHDVLTLEENQAVSLYCENYLDTAIAQGVEKIRAGTKFAHGDKTYTLPRTIEVVRDAKTGKKVPYIALNKIKNLDKLIGSGATKRVKLAVNLEDGTLHVRYTCLDSQLARKELEVSASHKVGLPIHGYLSFTSKKKPDEKIIGAFHASDFFPTTAKEVKMLAVYQPFAKAGDLISACESKLFEKMNMLQKLIVLETAFEQLESIHQDKIVHADIKPDNILLVEENGMLVSKIIDMERSHPAGRRDPKLGQTINANLPYRSPELLAAGQWDVYEGSPTEDLWAIGITFQPLFVPSKSAKECRSAGYKNNKQAMLSLINARISQGETSLIDKSCIPKNGMKLDDNSIQYVFWKLLQFDPANRISASAARATIKALRTI